MANLRKNARWYLLAAVAIAAVLVWSSVLQLEAHTGKLTFEVFDIGQGDSLLTTVTQS